MKNKLKEELNRMRNSYLWKRDIRRHRITKKNDIKKFIETLHPIQTKFELIRLGPNKDGGYLVPNKLDGIEACFSPGVGSISEFELDCLKNKMKVFLADKSKENPFPEISAEKYNFIKKFIGCTNNDDFITMDEWVRSTKLADSSELLLQMDIEGGEYVSFINMSDNLISRFRIMVVEFHSLHQIWDPTFFEIVKTVFSKILQTHICVHIHPNNCCGIYSKKGIHIPRLAEFTFLKEDYAESTNYATDFPHRLDYNNTTNRTIPLPKNWYKSIK
jgi:hypothetical protein